MFTEQNKPKMGASSTAQRWEEVEGRKVEAGSIGSCSHCTDLTFLSLGFDSWVLLILTTSGSKQTCYWFTMRWFMRATHTRCFCTDGECARKCVSNGAAMPMCRVTCGPQGVFNACTSSIGRLTQGVSVERGIRKPL